MNVNIHIERVILDGVSVSHHRQPLFQAAIESELTRLVSANGLPLPLLTDSAIPSVLTGVVELTSENDPAQLGQHLARAVYEGIGR